jgi:hypothetical protein
VRSCNHFCRGQARSVTHSECVSVVLVIQHAMCMRRIILPSVIFLAVLNFSTLSHKGHDFEEKFLNVKSVVWFPLQRLTKKFLILGRTERDKYRLLLSDFNKTWLLSRDFRKLLKYQIHEIRLLRAELFHADGQTVKTKIIVALWKSANAPKNAATRFTRIANSKEQK